VLRQKISNFFLQRDRVIGTKDFSFFNSENIAKNALSLIASDYSIFSSSG